MIYQGSKRRIAKKLVDIMVQPDTQCFVDLFCGGGNLLERVDCPHIIANDSNKYVIECLKALWGGTSGQVAKNQ